MANAAGCLNVLCWWCRLSQLRVKFSHEANCWVGLPPRLVSQLYEADHPRPLVLELKPAQGLLELCGQELLAECKRPHN